MRWLTMGAVCALATGAAQAKDVPLYQPAPDWVKPAPPITPAQLTASAPIYVLLDTQERLKDGQVWRYVDSATRVASQEIMTQAGMLNIPWQPDQGDVIVHKVEIIRGNEHIDLLAGGKRFTVLRREQKLEQREIDGTLTANMPIEGLRIGDVVHTTISVTNHDKALAENVQASAGLPAAPFRAGFTRTRFLWPADAAIRWKSYAEGGKPPVLSTVGGERELLIEGTLPKQPEQPDDAPPRFRKAPFVEVTSFADWAAVSRTMAPLYATDGLIAPGSPLAAEVARIKAAESDPLKRVALALDLVQEKVRYLYNGMAGGNYTPQTPADTWALRYGDCKAKTLLLLSLLHALDIEAEAVLAPAQAGDLLDGRLASPGAFDHVLVTAKVGDETLWLDGTMTGTKLADIRDVPAFRTVLPLRKTGAQPLAVPFRAPARPSGEAFVELDQRAGITMPILATVRMTMRGQTGAMIGLIASQATPEQTREMAQGAVNSLLGEMRLTDQSLAFDPATGIGTLTASGIVASKWERARGRKRMTLDRTVADLSFAPDRTRPAWRAIPVAIGAPDRTLYHMRLHLPGDGKGYELSGDRALEGAIAGRTVARRVAFDGATISVDDELTVVQPEIAADAIPVTRARVALAQSRSLEAVAPAVAPSHVAEVAAAKRSGALKPYELAYAKSIANDPEDKGVYTNRAYYRVGIYDYAAAIPDVSKAIEIEPDADLHLWRASLYEIAGDAKKQRADLEEAMQLAPDQSGPVTQLAQFMVDHGEKDAALAMIDERIAAGGTEAATYMSIKGDLLARTGASDAAVKTLDEAIAANPGNAGLLNSRCWIKGTMRVQLDSAIKDCTQSIELSKNRVAALDSRAMVYFRLDRLEEALTDLAAVLEEAPTQAASLYMRGVIETRQGRKAEGSADLLAARTIAPLIDRDYTRWGIRP